MFGIKRKTLIIVLLAVLFGVWLFIAPAPSRKKDGTNESKGYFTISKETTFVTGPLDQDRYIDYAAAIDKMMGEGVTPQNNGAVLLWQAHGPKPEGCEVPARFFQCLGIERPPSQGEYFVDFHRYARDFLRLQIKPGSPEEAEELKVHNRPWTAKEHANRASWLKVNEMPLALTMQATQRSHYFSPMVTSENGSRALISTLLPSLSRCRAIGTALRTRAMLRLGEGDYDGAWQDMLTCKRLGRMVSRGGTTVENLVGIAIDNIASEGCLVYLEHAKPSAKKLKECQNDLHTLPPFFAMADAVGWSCRFMFLDSIMLLDRSPRELLVLMPLFGKFGDHGRWGGIVPEAEDDLRFLAIIANRFLAKADWDSAMRNGNSWFDRATAAMRNQDRAARNLELKSLEAELQTLRKNMPDIFKAPLAINVATTEIPARAVPVVNLAIDAICWLQSQTAQTRGKLMGDMLMSLVLPAVASLHDASERCRQTGDNLHVAFALAHYQRDHGSYPEKLEDLAPKYLPQIPQDLFAGKPLTYRRTEDGYLLYSVGINEKDDNGRSYLDDPPGDDLAVRMPFRLP